MTVDKGKTMKRDRFREENAYVKRREMIFRTVMSVTMQIMLVFGLWEGGYCESQSGSSKPRFRFNELNLKHDHCGYPQLLDRDLWSCVCPMPYTKMGRECVCLGCMAEVSEEKYWKKIWNSYVDFAGDELKDEEAKKEDRNFGVGSNNSSPRSVRQAPDRSYEGPLLVLGSEIGEGENISTRGLFQSDSNYLTIRRVDGRPLVPKILRPKFRPLRISSKGINLLWLKKKPKLKNLKPIETSSPVKPQKTHMVPPQTGIQEVPLEALREKSTKPVREQPKNDDSGSFSDSVIFGETSGRASFGGERAFGTLSAYRGTGSMALGATNGSGAAVGFTGEGHSLAGIQSNGAGASGSVVVGPRAQKASSTMTMLAGKGDAVATNTLTDDASGSAVALATQGVASSSSAAFGAAVAGAAAAPGKGEAGGSSSYGTDTVVSAKVKGRDMVSETVSVGNANDSLREALAASPSKNMQRYRKTPEFQRHEEKTFDFFGEQNDPGEWFDN